MYFTSLILSWFLCQFYAERKTRIEMKIIREKDSDKENIVNKDFRHIKRQIFKGVIIANLRGWERQWCCPDRRSASQSKGSWEKKIDLFNWKQSIVYLNQKKLHLTWDPVTMTVLPRFSNIKESADAVYERVSVPWNILKQLLIAQMTKIHK